MIGVFLALILIIATSFIGLSLVKSQGIRNFKIMREKIALNENPAEEVIKSFSLFFAGILLLIPGFLTDIIGATLLLSPVQHYFVKRIAPKFKFSSYNRTQQNYPTKLDDIIEGDFKRKDDD
ncbi:FxsA family protein [Orbaceae bacterium ac157xtp]